MQTKKTHASLRLAAVMLVLTSCTHCTKDNTDQSRTLHHSSINWTGYASTHSHTGSFTPSGTLRTDKNGVVHGGIITIPISSIDNADLPTGPKEQLLTHLKSADFFNMAIHPNASFRITRWEPQTIAGDSLAVPGANGMLTGDFSLLGKTKTLRFPARIQHDDDSTRAEARFRINRLDYGMTSYNDPEASLYLLPDVDIRLQVVAGR